MWICTIGMPEEEKQALDDFCAERNITIDDLTKSFFIWCIENPETAKQWLIKTAAELSERTHEDWMSRLMLPEDAQKEENGEKGHDMEGEHQKKANRNILNASKVPGGYMSDTCC